MPHAPAGLWDWLLRARQSVGLMAQGFQRRLAPDGRVLPLASPAPQLLVSGVGVRVRVQLRCLPCGDASPQGPCACWLLHAPVATAAALSGLCVHAICPRWICRGACSTRGGMVQAPNQRQRLATVRAAARGRSGCWLTPPRLLPFLCRSATSPCLRVQAGLGRSRRVSLFLSDVEAEPWSDDWLRLVVSAAARVIVTHGERGALELKATGAWDVPVHPVRARGAGGCPWGHATRQPARARRRMHARVPGQVGHE
jgi:hypothetical protein